MKPAADVVVDTATGPFLQGNRHHFHGLAAGLGIHALDGGGAQQEAQIGGAREFGRATEAAVEPLFDPRRTALAACLQKLKPPQRDLVMRRYEPDGSVNAMAAAAGITPKAVSDRLRRIRDALLDCVNRAIAREAVT